MTPSAIGISGRMLSGKSSVSRELAARLGCVRAGFGDYVRHVARSEGRDDTDRKVLQELGQRLITADLQAFCRSTLTFAGWQSQSSVVVDGIRHVSVLQCLRTMLAPSPLRLVFLDVPDALLAGRLQSRGIEDLACLREFEKHATEVEVQAVLKLQADLVIGGHLEVGEIVSQIVAFLHKAGASERWPQPRPS